MRHDLFRYGGYITNIEFNFQAGAEPSTASVTIVSENGLYDEPDLGGTFSMPFDLGFEMNIVEYSFKRNGSSNILAIELVDQSVKYLDMNLVLVRGEHTTGGKGTDELGSLGEDEEFWLYPMLELPEEAWPDYAKNLATQKNRSYLPAAREPHKLKGSNNVWIIGGGRSIFAPTNQMIVPVVEEGLLKYKIFDPEEEVEFFFVYEEGEFKEDKSETAGENVVDKDNLIKFNATDVSIEFGYTAKELKELLETLNIRIKDVDGFLNNELILFNTSGTIRECLSAVSNKLGFFFYYNIIDTGDAYSGEIIVLGNAYIQQVNNNIQTIINNALDGSSNATTLSYSKTLRGIEANHVTLKGEISERERTRDGGYSGLNNVGRGMRFKRIPVEQFFAKNSEYIEKTALDDFYSLFLSSAKDETTLFNDYVWAYYMAGNNIGSLYDEAHCDRDNASEVYEPDKHTIDPTKEPNTDEESTVKIPEARDLKPDNLIQFDLIRTKERDEKTGELKSFDGNTSTSAVPPSESSLYEFLQLFYRLVFNLYISPAVPSYKAGQIAFSSGSMNIDDTPYNPNDKLKDVPALQEFVTLIEDYTPFGEKIKEKTVSELAELAGQRETVTEGSAVGTRMYFIGTRNKGGVLGIRDKNDLEQDEKIGKEIDTRIKANLISKIQDNKGLLICGTNYNANVVEYVKKKSEKLWKDVRNKDVENSIKVYYTRNNSKDISFDFDFDEQSIVRPNKYSLNNIPDARSDLSVGDSKLKVEKASHVFINGPKKEVDQFYDNLLDGDSAKSLVPFIEAPLVSVDLEYFRAPTANDINPQKGLDNFYISINDQGVTTRIAYSSKKLFPLDQEVLIADNRVAKNSSSIPRTFKASHKNFFKM